MPKKMYIDMALEKSIEVLKKNTRLISTVEMFIEFTLEGLEKEIHGKIEGRPFKIEIRGPK